MSKRHLVFLLALTLLITNYGLRITDSFAEEEFTITTYYPSPYGSYNELSTQKFSVGYTASSDEQPTLAGNIRLKSQPGDPTTWSSGKEGEIAYSSTKDVLYVSNGSSWVAQGAGTDIYFPKCSWSCQTYYSGGTWACTSNCEPPVCASGYTNLGTGCAAMGGGVALWRDEWPIGSGYGYCERYCAKQ
jgi:hypothetical protein